MGGAQRGEPGSPLPTAPSPTWACLPRDGGQSVSPWACAGLATRGFEDSGRIALESTHGKEGGRPSGLTLCPGHRRGVWLLPSGLWWPLNSAIKGL